MKKKVEEVSLQKLLINGLSGALAGIKSLSISELKKVGDYIAENYDVKIDATLSLKPKKKSSKES